MHILAIILLTNKIKLQNKTLHPQLYYFNLKSLQSLFGIQEIRSDLCRSF